MTGGPSGPRGLWIVMESTGLNTRLIGVFATFELAEHAARGSGVRSYDIANIEIGQRYDGRTVNWRSFFTQPRRKENG